MKQNEKQSIKLANRKSGEDKISSWCGTKILWQHARRKLDRDQEKGRHSSNTDIVFQKPRGPLVNLKLVYFDQL